MGTFDIDEKYALSIYHFNLQYKAGDKNSYFHLHRSSMKPFLRFFDRHPNWAVSLELQGHYLKFIERYFPDDLALFRKLNQRDQLELVSVHYSDQIYLAYPLRDLQESININKEIFKDLGLTQSGVWFGQEIFFVRESPNGLWNQTDIILHCLITIMYGIILTKKPESPLLEI